MFIEVIDERVNTLKVVCRTLLPIWWKRWRGNWRPGWGQSMKHSSFFAHLGPVAYDAGTDSDHRSVSTCPMVAARSQLSWEVSSTYWRSAYSDQDDRHNNESYTNYYTSQDSLVLSLRHHSYCSYYVRNMWCCNIGKINLGPRPTIFIPIQLKREDRPRCMLYLKDKHTMY